jgi:hypothetical protein
LLEVGFGFPQNLVNRCRNIRCYIPEECKIHRYRYDNWKISLAEIHTYGTPKHTFNIMRKFHVHFVERAQNYLHMG